MTGLSRAIAAVTLCAAMGPGWASAEGTRATAPAPAVRIDGQAVDVDAALQPLALQIFRLESQLYGLRRRAVDDVIAKWLLEREATRRSMSVAALLALEVDSKVVAPTDADVDARVARQRVSTSGTPDDAAELRQAARAALVAQRRAEAQRRFVASLREKAAITIEGLEPPDLRLTIATDGEPFLGPQDAAVTIVEFSDFQCPHCRQVQPTLKALLLQYPDKVRLVHRDFPVPQLHPGAAPAAAAARCAGEQHAFWPYRDLLYANPGKQAETDLIRYAAELRLDAGSFRDCVRQRRHAATVARGVADGKAAGVTGTPTFFVNGIPLVGAHPLSQFVELVERELSRRGP